ncbi:hypothetical protein P2G88_16095 [Aliiglaciecola sp. CAU 1673]|uniref:tetratricopeptide repeat protein n=1 Tax=Aliiglaciecola sp. CAU 1673 TaxID=3032595 RepID=UPI0023D9A64B|nr:tetratricopeptide repeat protein [Aliiglaciecola sp. CAU 1673]MDF2179773.1 hypothetical protein [Aliiglaciecola sp. CAU 1673]
MTIKQCQHNLRFKYWHLWGLAFCVCWALQGYAHEGHDHPPADRKQKSVTVQPITLDGLQQQLSKVTHLGFAESTLPSLQAALETLKVNNEQEEVRRLYLLAKLQQHQHDFFTANQTLQQALKSQPHNADLWLLKASVLNNLGEHEQAVKACEKLLAVADASIIAACVVETRMQVIPDHIHVLYAQLLKMLPSSDGLPAAQRHWTNEILATLALSMDEPELALSHLQEEYLADTQVSYIALWADVQLALNHHQQVLNKLVAITEGHADINDALLLRLAMAEKASDSGKKWLKAMRARIAQRSDEHNYAHAAELAKFYLYVEQDSTQASYWAKVNFNHAKSSADFYLLQETHQSINQTAPGKGM